MRRFVRAAAGLVLALTVLARSSPAQTLGTSFTYQGRLAESGTPASGPYDFRFILYDASIGGNQVGPIVTRNAVAVSTGLFTVPLDFGAVFANQRRFLEVGVRASGSGPAFNVLSGRQELTAAPSALFGATAPWAGLTGKPAGFADDVDNDTLYVAGQGISIVGTTVSVPNLGITSGMLASGSVTTAKIADNAVSFLEMADNAIGNAEMRDNAIGNAEMADDAIRSDEIAGIEVAVFQVNQFCGSSALTFASTCSSQQCGPSNFFTCAGSCTSSAAVTCPNPLRGYLLGTAFP